MNHISKTKAQLIRELEIETSLERVRSRILGMQESSEIGEVSDVLFIEFRGLGYDLSQSGIALMDVEKNTLRFWLSSELFDTNLRARDGRVFPLVPDEMKGSIYWKEWKATVESWQRGDKWHVTDLSGEALKDFFRAHRELRGASKSDALKMADKRVKEVLRRVRHRVFNKYGCLDISTSEPLGDDDLENAYRFSQLFEFAYSRYLEIKQKEDQNRELTVQNALERVRSRALGMQESSELAGVATSLFDELSALGLQIFIAMIHRWSKENDTHMMMTSGISTSFFEFTPEELVSRVVPMMKLSEASFVNEMIERFESGETYVSQEHRRSPDEARNYWQEKFQSRAEILGRDQEWIDRQTKGLVAIHPHDQPSHFFAFTNGALRVTTMTDLTEADKEMIKRFVGVFDFAYKRFLDLEAKEAQNRELTIQNALERVRARALGMQESIELGEVAWDLFEEVRGLGFDIEETRMLIMKPDEDSGDVWWAPRYFDRSHGSNHYRWNNINEQDWFQPVMNAWKRGDRWHIQEDAETQESYEATKSNRWTVLADHGVDQAEIERRLAYLPLPGQVKYFHHIFFFYGVMGFNVDSRRYTEEELDVLTRFTNAFEFAYKRFLELESKEAQNRELTIQNALERVRSRALGMQVSEEISGVATTLLDEFTTLGYDVLNVRIYVHDKTRDVLTMYQTSAFARDVMAWSESDLMSRKGWETPMSQIFDWERKVLAAKASGVPYHIRTIPHKESWQDTLEWQAENLGNGQDWVDQKMKIVLERAPNETCEAHAVFFDYGYLEIHHPEKLSEDDLQLASRFGDVFGFAYERFKELQEKEAQTREARRRAAVDRVRAEATAMQQSADVVQVLAGLWQGLQDAGLTFNTCGIQFVNEPANALTLYTIAETVDGMPEQKLFRKNVFDGVDIYATDIPLAFALEQGYATPGIEPSILTMTDTFPQDMASYWDTGSADIFARFAGVDMLNIPIANGGTVIFAPADHRYTEQDLQIGKDFADAISLGFTRYFDFQRLEEQNRKLEVANAEVREATRLKSQFLATMSHELRTPMNAIIGFTRLVLRRGKNLEDRQRENLEKVQLSADHLLSLINDILDLSKVEAGRVDIMASSFDVAPVIENCCATVGPTMGKPDVDLVPDIQGDMGQVHTDEARLRQVIINLVSNALKFTESGEVRVRAQLVKRDLEIVVSDTGIGIPEDQLETIFEEFRQVDNSSTRQHQGTGLGLAITKKLIELLGGTISVRSEEGKGSTFTLYIPSTYGEALQFRELPVISSRTRLIVSIDDDPNVAVLLRQELEEDGYQVISALNADEGIALVKQHKPLAVTTDILMPGKDGWQTIAALKEDKETRDIPIIVLSAIENRSLGFSMGVHDYLVKPFDHEGLISALSRIEAE